MEAASPTEKSVKILHKRHRTVGIGSADRRLESPISFAISGSVKYVS
jgi:hypothetical protein